MSAADNETTNRRTDDDGDTTAVKYSAWPERKQYLLAEAVCKRKAYIRTTDKFTDKYDRVISDLKKHPEGLFTSTKLSFPAIQNTFKRFQATVLKQVGISEEGANISGLPEKPTEYQTLMINMAEEVANAKRKRVKAKVGEKRKQKSMLTHERTGLQKQSGKKWAAPATADEDQDSDVSSLSGNSFSAASGNGNADDGIDPPAANGCSSSSSSSTSSSETSASGSKRRCLAYTHPMDRFVATVESTLRKLDDNSRERVEEQRARNEKYDSIIEKHTEVLTGLQRVLETQANTMQQMQLMMMLHFQPKQS